MHNFFKLHIKPYLLYFTANNSARFIIMGLIAVALILLFIERRRREGLDQNVNLEAIAGEDVMTTQLDLARTYIEMGQKDLASSILKKVKRRGNNSQRGEAKRLIETL